MHAWKVLSAEASHTHSGSSLREPRSSTWERARSLLPWSMSISDRQVLPVKTVTPIPPILPGFPPHSVPTPRKSLAPLLSEPWVRAPAYHSLSVQPRTRPLAFLSLPLLICKMGLLLNPTSQGLGRKQGQPLSMVPAQRRCSVNKCP